MASGWNLWVWLRIGVASWCCYKEVQWNLRIKDNLGPCILSVVRTLVSLGGQPIFSLNVFNLRCCFLLFMQIYISRFYIKARSA